MSDPIAFDHLAHADLHVDRVYEGGRSGNFSDDPLQRLLPVGNQGGFRYKGSVQQNEIRLVVLYTTGEDPDWPDEIDPFTGTVTYYGDNKHPGRSLHDTQRQGNEILRRLYDAAHGDRGSRRSVPPVLVFSKGASGRDVVFRGLAVPGSPTVHPGNDLVAVWRTLKGQRFQNYRATLTILDTAVVERVWLEELLSGEGSGMHAPTVWQNWVERAAYTPLVSARLDVRRRQDQGPETEVGRQVITAIHGYFNDTLGDPSRFEQCAVDLWKMLAPDTGEVSVTRRWRDGGRDAVGTYFLGPLADRLPVEFALEAKCYELGNAVGVREMSRLISRLRFRQFGVFVTTSYFNNQVYKEVRQDQHPIVLVCARDIIDVLRSNGIGTSSEARRWLASNYPLDDLVARSMRTT